MGLVDLPTTFGVTDSCSAQAVPYWLINLRIIIRQLTILKGTSTHVASPSYKKDGSAVQT